MITYMGCICLHFISAIFKALQMLFGYFIVDVIV